MNDPPEPRHTMPPLDLAEQGRQLHALAADFDALHTRVRDVSYTPGTDALQKISPLLLKAQEMTAAVLVRLSTLDSSAYTPIAGSRSSLECLASVAVASTLAGSDLASALLASPYDGAPSDGSPADGAPARTARHTAALTKVSGRLADACHQLDRSATGCRDAATALTHDLRAARDTAGPAQEAAVPALTDTQYDALKSLAPGNGMLYEGARRGPGVIRVATADGTRVSIATFRALNKRGLVGRDMTTRLSRGQKITVTKLGHQVLARPRPTTAAGPARTSSTPSAVRGARR
ncbi:MULTISPECIES: hypothetical protein [unclassified Streptomyces]|uniref:hypothetical protein n=1 Tax=unclassified Streptomyces TaxID=2593676 RepID=UPI003821788C